MKIYVKAKIVISQSETAMVVLRNLNQTWILFVGSLLGSIFGLMGSVAGLMKVTEGFLERYQKRKMAERILEERVRKRREICEQIFQVERLGKWGKVAPEVYEVKETYCGKQGV